MVTRKSIEKCNSIRIHFSVSNTLLLIILLIEFACAFAELLGYSLAAFAWALTVGCVTVIAVVRTEKQQLFAKIGAVIAVLGSVADIIVANYFTSRDILMLFPLQLALILSLGMLSKSSHPLKPRPKTEGYCHLAGTSHASSDAASQLRIQHAFAESTNHKVGIFRRPGKD